MKRCVGNLLGVKVLLFIPFTRCWLIISISLSLGRLFGSLRSPLELLFFVWTTALGNILTIDNLRKRHILILDWCCMCKINGESIDHLFIHCSIDFDLWSMVFTLFGIHWVMSKTVVDLLACWQGKLGRHRNSAIWMAMPHCLMWCIWREMNNWHFEDLERLVADLKLFWIEFQCLAFVLFLQSMVSWTFVLYALDLYLSLMYTSCILRWLPSSFLYILITYKKKKLRG